MDIVLGIDVGGSTTKIVGLQKAADRSKETGCHKEPDRRKATNRSKETNCRPERCLGMLQVRAADQITSMYGAIGGFLRSHGVKLEEVSSVYLTGVGASFIDEEVYGIKTIKVDEFKAIGYGALRLTGLSEALVVSMGTGTAFVKAAENEITHLGGSGVGGGTIIGLASQMLGKSDVDAILALADKGNLENIDLTIRDILGREVRSLPANLTAANFGKIKSTASDSDIALGIINMVFEIIGMLAVFALKNDDIRDVVLTGTLATFPQVKTTFAGFNALTGLNFIVPPDAVYSTALGAAYADM